MDEYPQAVADDYPGWDVRHHDDGQWTASCPAITVQATTAAGLRAAIERAPNRRYSTYWAVRGSANR